MAKNPKLIGNKSDGYNYKYTSLGDLVLNGVELPSMRVAILTDGAGNPVLDPKGNPIEFIEAERKNGDVAEWVRGARVVIPSGNKQNEAQAYGSAITYARRYTALMLLGIACEDDNKIEVHSKSEAMEQELENMKNELEGLYKKAGGKAFNSWLEERGGLTYESYRKLKTELLKRINDALEKGEKDESN